MIYNLIFFLLSILTVMFTTQSASMPNENFEGAASLYSWKNISIRIKRQNSSPMDQHIKAWQRIYLFTLKASMAFGNNALLFALNEIISNMVGNISRSYTYGYRRGCGGGAYGRYGYGGSYGYGGYGGLGAMSYAMQPVYYYVPVTTGGGTIQQEVFPIDGINGFTGSFGTTLSNTDLLEQLIAIIQETIDQTATYYSSGGGGGGASGGGTGGGGADGGGGAGTGGGGDGTGGGGGETVPADGAGGEAAPEGGAALKEGNKETRVQESLSDKLETTTVDVEKGESLAQIKEIVTSSEKPNS